MIRLVPSAVFFEVDELGVSLSSFGSVLTASAVPYPGRNGHDEFSLELLALALPALLGDCRLEYNRPPKTADAREG